MPRSGNFERILLSFCLILYDSQSVPDFFILFFSFRWKFRPYANNPYTLLDEDEHDDDLESALNEGETHGLQTMSRREGRTTEHDE